MGVGSGRGGRGEAGGAGRAATPGAVLHTCGAALGPVLDMPVIVHRQVPQFTNDKVVDICLGAEAVSLGPDYSENH